jgi:glucokinase
LLLVADIGATHARLALVSPQRGPAHPVREATLPSQEYPGLLELIAAFLRPAGADVERAVLAVAGPVVGGRAELTNLGWTVDEATLRDALGVSSVRLLNDLVAMAYAVPHLSPDALRTLQRGTRAEGGAIGVVAPGTGLGEAFLIWDGARYRACPSEGGHADFAPADALQCELLEWLRARMRGLPVSCEHVCSGRGLPSLYDFLKERGTAPEESWLAERLAAADDRTPVIVEAALDPGAPSALCVATLELFASILAGEAGNAALRLLATAGVYLGGGMPRRILPILERPGVIDRFRRKDRMSTLLSQVPLHVIVARRVPLLGAAYAALG